MKKRITSIIKLSILISAFSSVILIPATGFAQNPFTDRAGQIEGETGINLGTYQQAAEETARRAAEERKKAGEELKFDFGLEIGKVLLGGERLAIKAYTGAKDWIFSNIDKISSDETVPAVKEPVISIFSAVKGLFTNLDFSKLKSEGYIPFTKESKLRAERIKNLSTPPQPIVPGAPSYELPLGLSDEGFPVSGSSLVAPLSATVPLECRYDILISCNTCPSAPDPEKFEKKAVFPESCAKCITDNYERLEICKINAKFPIKKPVDDAKKPIEDNKNPSDDTGGAVIE